QNARRLVVVRNSQDRKRPRDLLSGSSHVIDIDQRQTVLLILIEGILKLDSKPVRRIGGAARPQAQARFAIRLPQDSGSARGSIAEFVPRPSPVEHSGAVAGIRLERLL